MDRISLPMLSQCSMPEKVVFPGTSRRRDTMLEQIGMNLRLTRGTVDGIASDMFEKRRRRGASEYISGVAE